MAGQITYRLENILVKNASLEVPENVVTPTFTQKPEVQLEVRNKTRPLNMDNYHEVSLEGTARIKSGDDLQVLIEVLQAGVFYIEEADSDTRQQFLGIHAPTILYPYFTYLINDLMAHAGAPRVFLPPFNFSLVYQKKQEILRKKLEDDNSEGSVPS
ncbi:MAG: protein-export chaperone SecB [Proteobacteria bacterium]|nr:protein-export chaperone SecB [Pseudomonadota bacterium]MCH9758798.1 protein-export chaperone SecB [Pseudomonadota bacterium]